MLDEPISIEKEEEDAANFLTLFAAHQVVSVCVCAKHGAREPRLGHITRSKRGDYSRVS